MEYLLALQQIRRKCESLCERKLRSSSSSSSLEEAHKASQANVKRQFAIVATEFRGHANTMVEEMTAYMRVLHLCAKVDM